MTTDDLMDPYGAAKRADTYLLEIAAQPPVTRKEHTQASMAILALASVLLTGFEEWQKQRSRDLTQVAGVHAALALVAPDVH